MIIKIELERKDRKYPVYHLFIINQTNIIIDELKIIIHQEVTIFKSIFDCKYYDSDQLPYQVHRDCNRYFNKYSLKI